MKFILRNYGVRMTTEQRQVAKAQALDMLRTRGTGNRPLPPRDLFLQPGPRGVLLNWRAPAKGTIDIAGYRIYKDDENGLFAEIRDPGTLQHYIETTAGSTPPVTNLFVSTVNKLGVESPKVNIQGTAITESGAPTMPSTPPTFTTTYNPRTTRQSSNI